LSRQRVGKGSTQKPEEVCQGKMREEIHFMRLENIPIEDALHEKKIFERGDFERKLNPRHSPGPVIISDDARLRRIIEVYKRCFQEANLPNGLKVVRDFIAHFPRLAFDADWLKEQLFRVDFARPDIGDERKREILSAIAKGFRRAANPNPRASAIKRSYRKSGARMAARTFQDELSKWNEALDRAHGEKEWIASRAAEKAEELIKRIRD